MHDDGDVVVHVVVVVEVESVDDGRNADVNAEEDSIHSAVSDE